MDNVILHIYDLLPESRSQQQQTQTSTNQSSSQPAPTSSITNLFSGLLAPLGFGAYHTCLDVRGFRYQFGAGFGIVRTTSSQEADSLRYIPPNGAYRESIVLGQTWYQQKDINAIVQRMRDDKFKAENYHLANRNCNHFSEVFAMALILGQSDVLLEDTNNNNGTQRLEKYPAWVNRLARTGTSLGIDDGNACTDLVSEARVAAGVKGKVGWDLSSSNNSSNKKKSNTAADKSRSQKKELTEKQKAVLAKLKKGSK